MAPLPWITVVSGLPRSGTSLMMQALAAGGISPLTDAWRTPDESNPRGYLELEAVKRLKTERGWLPDARGKAVKIIHLLLGDLAAASDGQTEFRVVMMRRPIEEVVASQRTMLTRQGRAGAMLPDAQLGKIFLDQLERIERVVTTKSDFQVLTVQYPALVEHPAEEAARINAFLGGTLDETAMVRAVDPALYRERKS